MREYFTPLNWKIVGRQLVGGFRLLGVVLAVPFFVSLLAGDFGDSLAFGILAACLFTVGHVIFRMIAPENALELKEALVTTALLYLVFSLIGAVPFLKETSFLNALFESLSGFTTTGLSVLEVSKLSASLLFFRAYCQWIGGAGIVVLSLAILLRSGGAALKLYSSESSEENIMGSVVATARVVLRVYLVLTVLCIAAFWAAGMRPFDAVLHALATVSTGGFSPFVDSIGHYSATAIQVVTVIFMWSGAISFSVWFQFRQRKANHSLAFHQGYYLLVLSVVGLLVFALSFGASLRSFSTGLFQAASAVTTTGFSNVDQSSLSAGAKLITIILMVIGGSTGSTAGGIKIFRLIVLIGLARWLLTRVLLPQGATVPIKAGERNIDDQALRLTGSFVVLYLAILVVSALILMFTGYSFADSLFEAASAQGTVGLSVGITSASMPTIGKLVLMFQMWLGRLEIIPVLIAFYPGIWVGKQRRTRA
jgi:trk system potassium uptake protein